MQGHPLNQRRRKIVLPTLLTLFFAYREKPAPRLAPAIGANVRPLTSGPEMLGS